MLDSWRRYLCPGKQIEETNQQIIDDDHAIVSSTSGPEYYVPIMSFVDKELLEPGCSVLLHQKVHHPKLEKALTFRVSLLSGC